ncbi:aldehyde dehydrogenase family protein [Brevibacterium yomogidense]|uniref:aldehyde dehydrogenase family protein n=1 Tax=Brevibacterium yomogidense TaxID=946573 RepID=UPI0018DFDE7E|nr:aldehyde dehydrogenase family protein [Brevibacterium yomogidense]
MTATAETTAAASSHLTVIDPQTGEDVGTVRCADAAEAAETLALARRVQPGWARTPAEERGAALHAAADALAAAGELAELNQRETGKPLADARGGVDAGVGALRQSAELGPLHRGHSLRGDVQAADYTLRRPHGVAAVLTPWNDPVAVAVGLIAAAVTTGNVVVHKPSERNPHVGILLGEVLSDALPHGVLQTLTGDGAVGRMLTGDQRVDVIAHVGSTATGSEIAAAAARTGAHVVRENGGNDAMVVDAGVDPVWAASQAALGCFANVGQICTSTERVYVHRSIADDFVAALQKDAERRNGEPVRQPVVDRAHRDHVHAHVEQALTVGAEAIAGGTVPEGPGAHYPATVLTGCTSDMTVMREETFGPVAPVQVVDDFDEGLRLAEADRYGLAATLLTARIDHALAAATELHVGTVKVNSVFRGAPGGSAHPHKESGKGFGYGPELLDEMTTTSVVHLEAARVPGGTRALDAGEGR